MKQFLALVQANFLLQVRNRQALIWNLFFPIFLMLLFGTLYNSASFKTNTGGAASASLNYASYMVPGLIILSALSTGMIGFASSLATYREKGIFRRIRTTPMPIVKYLGAKILVQMVVVLVQAAILALIGVLVFQATFDYANLWLAILVIVLIALVFVSIGQMIAAIVTRSETVGSVTQIINIPCMVLGGLFIPLSQFASVPVLPQLGSLLPTGVAVNLLRPIISPEPFKQISDVQGIMMLPAWAYGLILLAYVLIAVVVSVRFFKWEV